MKVVDNIAIFNTNVFNCIIVDTTRLKRIIYIIIICTILHNININMINKDEYHYIVNVVN